MQALWLFYALGAAVFWGLSYTISEQLLRKFSLFGVMLAAALGAAGFSFCFGLARGDLARDWQALKKPDGGLLLVLFSVAVYVAANTCILLSTKEKNATMAAMVEIAYPLFTALFAYLLFRQVQVTAGTLFGASLVLAGVCCIYYFGKNL